MLALLAASCVAPACAEAGQVAPIPIPLIPLGPVPFAPALPAPPLPTNPLDRALAGAYGAIGALGPGDPSAAQAAAGLYLQARQRAQMGDVSGALAFAASARAAALMAAPRVPLAPAVRFAMPPARSATVPLADRAALLPTELLFARDAIERAERTGHASTLDFAKERYRSALTAYLAGDAARAVRDARAALEAANSAQRKGK